jgi:hypothetical protein
MEDNDEEQDEFDEDLQAAVAVAEEYAREYDDHLILASSLKAELKEAGAEDEVEGLEAEEEGDVVAVAAEDDENVEEAAAAAFERLLAAASSSEQDEETLLEFVGAQDLPEAEDVQDKQSAGGLLKYDEEEYSGISEEDRAGMIEAKLTKEELANLVPEVRCCRSCMYLHV